MKSLYYIVPLFTWLSVSSPLTLAQDAQKPTVYQVIEYMKVAPGMDQEYLALEAAWKKIHVAREKAGTLNHWELSRVLSPAGANVEYNYVTRNTFVGNKQLAGAFETPFLPENWTSLLTSDEVALVMRTGEIRTLVKSEVWAEVETIFAENMSDGTIMVVNYFDHPEGKNRSDHFSMERKIWMPIHQMRVKQGKMKGWVLGMLVMPFGSKMPYQDVTVDIYKDMSELLGVSFPDYFQAVYPGQDMEKLFTETHENSNLVKGEVRMRVDGI